MKFGWKLFVNLTVTDRHVSSQAVPRKWGSDEGTSGPAGGWAVFLSEYHRLLIYLYFSLWYKHIAHFEQPSLRTFTFLYDVMTQWLIDMWDAAWSYNFFFFSFFYLIKLLSNATCLSRDFFWCAIKNALIKCVSIIINVQKSIHLKWAFLFSF